jgi:hypothetical protein
MTFALMLLVAGGVADRGRLFPVVLLGTAAGAAGLLYLLFPHGPQFAIGAATGLAMYACLYVVIGRAAFPGAEEWARHLGFLLPVVAFVAACWLRRRALRASTQGRRADLAHHLPRVGRWMAAVAAIGTLSLRRRSTGCPPASSPRRYSPPWARSPPWAPRRSAW